MHRLPRGLRFYSSSQRRVLVNRLGDASSPYLRSHSANPVAWQQWSSDTLKLAKELDRPIFLSIGYNACHWCHVMNRESFQNTEIAGLLNTQFVPIKVDKEQYPDIDSIYMMYLQSSHGAGGWPLNVFLTPDTLEPFFGGTYWAGPSVDENRLKRLSALPFTDILQSVVNQWDTNRSACETSASKISKTLANLVDQKSSPQITESDSLDKAKALREIEDHLEAAADQLHGGYGTAPKFSMPSLLSFCFRNNVSEVAKEHAHKSLRAVFHGGIKDQIGHGVSRYSVSADWLLPHFEKMLVDQALLLQACLDAKTPESFTFAHDLADFLVSGPLRQPGGGFHCAIDAESVDPDGVVREGAYYTWPASEFEQALKDEGTKTFTADIAATFYGVLPQGNIKPELDHHGDFVNLNVLSVVKTPKELSEIFGKPEQEIVEILRNAKQQLSLWRDANRKQPQVDAKLITSWNGAAIASLARAGRELGRQDCLEAAAESAELLWTACYENGDLKRTIDGLPAVCDDYCWTIAGLLELYAATFDIKYLARSLKLQKRQTELFGDTRGGFYAAQDLPYLLYRPKSGFDGVEPSCNGVSAKNLVQLAKITGNESLQTEADQCFNVYRKDIEEQPQAYATLLDSQLVDYKVFAYIVPKPLSSPQCLQQVRELQSQGCLVVKVDAESVTELSGYEKLWLESDQEVIVPL